MQVTPPPVRSDTQGALAGLVASILGVPMLAVGLVVGLVLQASVLHKILHHEVEYSDTREGGTAILANIVLAILIGFFAALASGMISMKLVKNATPRSFLAVTAIGSLLIAFLVDHWLLRRAQGHYVDLWLLIAFGWVAAMAGFYLVVALPDAENAKGRKPRS